MPHQRTAQKFDRFSLFADNRLRLTTGVERFGKLPKLNAAIQDLTSNHATEADMAAIAAVNTNFEIAGTNATASHVTREPDKGGVKLTTAGASADQTGLIPHTDTGLSPFHELDWDTSASPAFYGLVTTGSAVTAQILMFGLRLTFPATLLVGDDNDGIVFWYNSADASFPTTWQMVVSVGGSDTQYDLGVEVAADTTYELVLEVDSRRYGRAYINGNQEGPRSAQLTASIDLLPMGGIEATTGAAKHCYLHELEVSRSR